MAASSCQCRVGARFTGTGTSIYARRRRGVRPCVARHAAIDRRARVAAAGPARARASASGVQPWKVARLCTRKSRTKYSACIATLKKAQGGQVQEGELNEELTRVRPSRDPAAAAVDGQLNTLEFQNSFKPGRRLDSCSVDGGDAVAGMTEHGTTTYYTGWRRNNNFIHSTHIELT
eukprot:COSAG02_NODE_2196_length_9548_cov_2.748227_2_plen_176_part_00